MPKVMDDILGSIEALTAAGSGALAVPISSAIGLAKGLPKIGTKEGGEEARRAAGEAQEKMTYAPRTASGQSQTEALARLLESAKIPPFIPGAGRLAQTRVGPGAARHALETTGEAVLPRIDTFMEGTGLRLNAVKQPGGHFSPMTGEHLRRLLVNQGEEANIGPWADKMVPRYLNKHIGTDRDPANRIPLGEGTYENAMDKMLRSVRLTQEDLNNPDSAGQVPLNVRPGEDVWMLNRTRSNAQTMAQWEQMLQHAGDYARTLPPRDLERMGIPELLLATARADAQGLKAKKKSGDARLEAAARMTAEHPAADVLHETDAGRWLRFHKGQDPEFVKRGLSVDTCIGDHCVAGVAHGKPEWGYPGWVPARDLVTGQKVRPDMRDSTSYIDKLLAGRGDILSLRTHEGIPAATMGLNVPPGQQVNRSYVRDQLLGKPAYLAWQRAQREAGVPREQHAPELPSIQARANEVLQIPDFMGMPNDAARAMAGVPVGGGKISPPRGPLGPDQIRTMSEMYPQYAERLAYLLANPAQEIQQFKGFRNGPMHPKFQEMTAEMLNRQSAGQYLSTNTRGMGSGDMDASGMFTKGAPGEAGRFHSAVSRMPRIAGNAELMGDYETAKHIHLLQRLLQQRDPRVQPVDARDLASANRYISSLRVPE